MVANKDRAEAESTQVELTIDNLENGDTFSKLLEQADNDESLRPALTIENLHQEETLKIILEYTKRDKKYREQLIKFMHDTLVNNTGDINQQAILTMYHYSPELYTELFAKFLGVVPVKLPKGYKSEARQALENCGMNVNDFPIIGLKEVKKIDRSWYMFVTNFPITTMCVNMQTDCITSILGCPKSFRDFVRWEAFHHEATHIAQGHLEARSKHINKQQKELEADIGALAAMEKAGFYKDLDRYLGFLYLAKKLRTKPYLTNREFAYYGALYLSKLRAGEEPNLETFVQEIICDRQREDHDKQVSNGCKQLIEQGVLKTGKGSYMWHYYHYAMNVGLGVSLGAVLVMIF